METWIWLLIAYSIISNTTPYTSKIGALFEMLTIIAVPIFCLLCFFFADEWWYGLIALGIYLLGILVFPKINPDNMGTAARVYSGIFSHIAPIIVVLMYLSLFEVI